jgi:DNA-binding transcriptional MocR family regulator
MEDHARILKPKFDAVQTVLIRELDGKGLAEWTRPKGGYFVSLDTKRPVALRVVDLARRAGLSPIPAVAAFPYSRDPGNSNIRISPTRPPVSEIEKAMEVPALCIKPASAEYDAKT